MSPQRYEEVDYPEVEAEAGPSISISVPDDASEDEAAAIAVAIGAHIRDREVAAAEAAAAEDSWRGTKWTFSGRIEGIQGVPARVTDDTPRDAWTAAGRTDRMR